MSYSIDLRERVIKFIEAGNSKTGASRIFGISRPALYSWLAKKSATGTVKDAPPKRGWKKLNPEALIAYVKEHPDLHLADYAKHFSTSIPSVCQAFKRLKITRKKRPPFTENAMKRSAQHIWSR